MAATYYRYKILEPATTFPAWQTTWPGLDGCSGRVVSHLLYTTSQPPSIGSPLSYEPERIIAQWSDPGKRGKLKGVPPFCFTDYYVGKRIKREYLVTVHWGQNGVLYWKQYGDVHKVNQSCTPSETSRQSLGPAYALYDEQLRDFATASIYEKSYIDQGEVLAASIDLRNELVSEASSSYDLLTDITQVKDIPKTVSQVAKDLTSILRSLRSRHSIDVLRRAFTMSPKRISKQFDKLLKNFGDEWMNYRYGIMPLVYSFNDMVKTLNRGQSVKTRKQRIITPKATNTSLPVSGTYRILETKGEVILRGEIFQHFTSDEIARLSGVGMNPLVTAWELIPYSFVFDWFYDVGSYIAAKSSSSWASRRDACLSRRDNYTIQTFVYLQSNNKSYQIANKLPTNWLGASPPANPDVVVSNPAGPQLLEEEIVDTYWRRKVPFSGLSPTFNPSLNWRRLLDGAVLSLNQMRKFLRSF